MLPAQHWPTHKRTRRGNGSKILTIQGKAFILHMRSVCDHQRGLIGVARVDHNTMTTPKGLIGVTRSTEVPDVLSFGTVLNNVILPVAIYYIKIPIRRIDGCLCRDKLPRVFVPAGLFGIFQLKNFLPL